MTAAAAAPSRPLPEILAERIALVGEVTRLNAEQLRHRQLAGGVEVELLLRRQQAEAARLALDEISARDRGVKAEIAARERRLATLEARLEEIDRELAAGTA